MPLIIVPENIPTLPANAAVTYLDEGAANIVYQISIPYPSPSTSVHEEYGDGTPPPSEIEIPDDEAESPSVDLAVFDDKLLRLRKNLATAPTCFVSQAAYLRLIAPLFEKSQLVEQSLVKVNPTNLIQRLNFELQTKETGNSKSKKSAARLAKRHGTYLAKDGYGLLVTDMTPNDNHKVIQFKPKWLSQSPSAPPSSVRCRQCAYTACANAQLSRTSQPLLPAWCPLALLSSDRKVVHKAAEQILYAHDKLTPFSESIDSLTDWIMDTTLLRRLRDHQLALDTHGPLNADANDESFRLAMTLRDVTAYLRFPVAKSLPLGMIEDTEGWEARLGDLDIKSADKGPVWKEKERELIGGGWYKGCEGGGGRQPVTCYLAQMN